MVLNELHTEISRVANPNFREAEDVHMEENEGQAQEQEPQMTDIQAEPQLTA